MKSNRRRDEITSIAASLFKSKGYAAVSMRDIARELDIKAASLYNHITSKQEILALIVIEVAEDFTNHIDTLIDRPISSIQKLEEIIHMHVEITIEKTNALACLNSDWMHLDNTPLNYYVQMREDYEAKFRQILTAGIEKGELKTQNIEVILFSILSTLRTFYLWYPKKKELSPEQLKKEITATLLHGVIAA